MPLLFVFGLILAALGLLGLAVFFLFRKSTRADDRSAAHWGMGLGVTLIVGAVLATFFSSFSSVGTYDIGVTTNFGRVISYVGPGAHFIAPWDNMVLMDESVQQTNDVLTVRVAGQQTAIANVKLRWQLVPGATDSLFKLYKGSTANIATALVTPELNVAMNSVYDGYDPILPLSTGAPAGSPDNPSTAQLSARVQAALTTKIGGQIKIISLIVQPLKYDDTVEARINSVLAQTAKTDVAKQSEQTALAQAAANKALQQNVTPLTLVQQCMNAISDGQLNPPAGFSCWPGSGSGVVIPAQGSSK